MIKENESYSNVIETKFNKPLIMSEKDQEDLNNSITCWICKKRYEEGEVKVKDLHHVTAKYRGFAHREYNLNLILSKKL